MAGEFLQGGIPGWYFSKKEIDDHSPSRKDGIDLEKESELRKLYCSFLQDLGMKLKVPQVTISVAMMLCHRFYMRQSHLKNEWQTIATVIMFLSCKMEETPRLLMEVVVVAYEIMYRTKPEAAERIKQKDVYNKQKELIVTAERVLLVTIAFDFNIQLPYKRMVAALKRMEISKKEDVAKVAWNFVNDWMRTTLCLQYKPDYIAAGSIYLAAKFHKVKLRSVNEKVLWMELDVIPQRLEEVIQQMLRLLETRTSIVPSCPKNTTQSTLIKKELPNSTRSNTTNGLLTTGDTSDHGLRDNHSLPDKDTCEARREDLKQSQTGNSGSSGSGVEDGDSRSNKGEVLVESIQVVSSIKTVSIFGGLSQIEMGRIKEAVRKRKLNRVVNNKKLETENDGDYDSMIMRIPFLSSTKMATSLAARLTRKTLKPATIRPLIQSISGPNRPFSTAVATDSSSSTPLTRYDSDDGERLKWDYRGQRQVIPLGQWLPTIAVDAYVAPNVVLAGQVTVCDGSSVWSGSVLRGDLNKITVGFCSNVQERCVLHAAWSSPTGLPAETLIERFVTVGAYSLLRSCTIEPECIIGQRSILMEGSLVETHSILEAGSVLPPGRRIPSGELWAGNPARYVRSLTHEEILEIPKLAVAINDLSKTHFSEFLPYSTVYLEVEKLKKSFGIPI